MSIADLLQIRMDRRKVMIKCPMPGHHDNTASFIVDDENTFHCFGCTHPTKGTSTHGFGMIDFLEQMGYSFKQIMDEYYTE